MLIGGLQPLTLIDFPDKVSAILFTAGCNMRCGYCHNPELVLPELIKKNQKNFVSEDDFWSFLDSRKGFLDGIVISGGEPTLQPDLIPFLETIKSQGFLIKLDTNGTAPDIIEKIIERKLVDYIAMDIKSPLDDYEQLVATKLSIPDIKRSQAIIKNSGLPYEFRTTVINGFHSMEDIKSIIKSCIGAKKYTIQNFRNQKTLSPKFGQYTGFTAEQLSEIKAFAEKYIQQVEVLG
jgi:pyruvate formate lyase activating enzyme